MKPGPIIAIVVILAALGFGAFAFKGSLIAYVPFSQAVAAASTGSTVQIIGAPIKGDTNYNQVVGALSFKMKEPGTGAVMPVIFKSPKPDNFDSAIKVTAIGHYDTQSQQFMADNLLVKCPSKYAGQSSQDRSYVAKS
ncbi:MAG TPA: cytochrome c maturation protein CcmE [Capsulimonadaceae bacterium]|nr:cytochrome c maturation protein CcmE [Capsulimonadaceae bacterium]